MSNDNRIRMFQAKLTETTLRRLGRSSFILVTSLRYQTASKSVDSSCLKCLWCCSKTIYLSVHIYIYIYTHTKTHIYTYTYIYPHTLANIYMYIHIHIHTYMYIYIHTHIYIYILICELTLSFTSVPLLIVAW